jgi:hypothetical protein
LNLPPSSEKWKALSTARKAFGNEDYSTAVKICQKLLKESREIKFKNENAREFHPNKSNLHYYLLLTAGILSFLNAASFYMSIDSAVTSQTLSVMPVTLEITARIGNIPISASLTVYEFKNPASTESSQRVITSTMIVNGHASVTLHPGLFRLWITMNNLSVEKNVSVGLEARSVEIVVPENSTGVVHLSGDKKGEIVDLMRDIFTLLMLFEVVLSIVAIYGAWNFKKRKSRNMVILGAICAILSIGPFGVSTVLGIAALYFTGKKW